MLYYHSVRPEVWMVTSPLFLCSDFPMISDLSFRVENAQIPYYYLDSIKSATFHFHFAGIHLGTWEPKAPFLAFSPWPLDPSVHSLTVSFNLRVKTSPLNFASLLTHPRVRLQPHRKPDLVSFPEFCHHDPLPGLYCQSGMGSLPKGCFGHSINDTCY